MSKARYKPEDLAAQREPEIAVLPSEQPTSPFLSPSEAQAEPQGSELYNLGTVQQRVASTRDADMYMPSYLQAPQNYPTGTEGSVARPSGGSPLLYPSAAELKPRVRPRYKPEEALALAEANRPKRYSPDQVLDAAAETMFDASQQPLPMPLWKAASERRAEMVKDGRLPMEFGQIGSLRDGLVWSKDAAFGVASYIANTAAGAVSSVVSQPIESLRQSSATIPAAAKRFATEFGLQTYQDIFNLTHEPKYRVKETGQFVAVNKTGLPLMLPAASGGNNVISADGVINPVAPDAGIRQFAKDGMTLVPVSEQDLEEYRYGQYLDRMAVGAQSMEDMKTKAPPEFLSALASGRWDAVEPNQAQTELSLLAAQAVIPVGGSARTWGVGRRAAGGLSRAAGVAETVFGKPVDIDTALRAKFVSAITSKTGADAVAQKTAMQAAIDASKTSAKVGGAYAVAAGVSSFEGTPSELKDLAWTAANLYSGYKGGMFVARQLRAASGFTKTVLKEVADPAQGLDAGARAAVAANPAVPQSVREVLESPSRFRSLESTPARLAQNTELSPTSRAIFGKLSDYRFVQAARLARDTAAGVPKGMLINAPFVAGALASDDSERAGQMLAAGGIFGAVGGAATRFTEANVRRGEEATSDIARMLVDIQAGNELASGLGGDILRNRVRPGTRFQDGERGFVMPEQEVASFLTEMEMAGADVAAFVQGKSFDELAQWAAYQGFFRDKVDLVPLNAADYKLNAEAAGQNGSGAYFLQPSEGRRARIFVNAESRRNGLAPHEYGHAVLRGGALSPDQIDAVHADINGRYTPDALKAMANEYAAGLVRAENVKAGIDIEPSPAALEAKVNELTQSSMIKGSADGLDWLREEIFAEEFRNANIDFARARRNIPLGANPVSFMENLLGAQSRALHMAGIDIDPQTGKPMGRDQIFKENRVAAGDPVVMKNYEAYVKQWRQWIKDPTHEIDPGVAVSKAGNVQDTANNPNVTWRDYGGGRMENEFGIKNPDGTVTPKDWKRDIKPTVRARQQAVREMSNRSKQVASADDPTFGMRTRRDGRREVSGRVLPDSFFYIPQYKPFHSDIRKIVAADNAGETLQVRFFAKGKSKDVFKDGIKGVNAVNREAMHGNFVAKKDGALMWGYLDMTQFRNRAMKAIADRNPALEPYNWDFKALMDDLPTHLRDQASGRGGAVTVGPERANVLNGLIGIGTGPLVGAFGKGTAYKTIHLDSIDAVVPTGKQGGQFDVYRANRNAMPDDPKPPVDMDTDLSAPRAIPQSGQAMPDVADVSAGLPRRSMESRGKTQIADDGTITYNGKEPADWTPEDFAAFGKEFGVRNLGPLSKVTRITDELGRDIASIPGGLDGEFTYYDLLWLKANPVDVASLPVELHGKLTAKLARTMTPEPGNKVQKFNGIVFGFLSANAPLLPNEMGQSRLRFGSMKEIEDFGNLLPDNPSQKQLADVNARLKKELGFSAAEAGGMGIGLSQDLSNIVMAAKLFSKNPDFFIKRADESWGAFVDKVSTQLKGLGTKTASFGTVWQDPLMAAISAMDRHMSRVFSKELLTNPAMKQRFEGIVVKRFNSGLESAKKVAKSYEGKIKRAKNEQDRAKLTAERDSELAKLPDPRAAKAKTIDDVLAQAERFGEQRVRDFVNEAAFSAMGTRKGKYITAKGDVNPNVPESLRGVEWVQTPQDFQVMSDAYRAALELNEARAKDIGIEVFPAQWTLWDRIRQRVEPHEAMFPSLEKLPALNDRQLGMAFSANKAAGYMTTPEQGKAWRRQSGISPSSLAYFTPAVLAAGAAAAATDDQ